MIFVTVGTHEQAFDRLISYIDNLVKDGTIKEEVIIQSGFCTYEPKYCVCNKFYPYDEVEQLVEKARIVITHGGPSSFVMPLQIGKTPIVVPRQKKYDEHVNDHQVMFAQHFLESMGNILVALEMEQLKDMIIHYDELTKDMQGLQLSNNKEFNAGFEKIVKQLFD